MGSVTYTFYMLYKFNHSKRYIYTSPIVVHTFCLQPKQFSQSKIKYYSIYIYNKSSTKQDISNLSYSFLSSEYFPYFPFIYNQN